MIILVKKSKAKEVLKKINKVDKKFLQKCVKVSQNFK